MRSLSAADRPTLAGSRRTSWKVWLFQEWGLLLLAAALAVIIWEITSQRVVKSRWLRGVEIRLEVDPSLRDRVGAVLTGKTTRDFEVICSERERNEALEALDQEGRPVVVIRITEPLEAGKRALNARIDKYAWPFANHDRILSPGSADAPDGEVFALAQANPSVKWSDPQKATVPSRSDLDARGIDVTIKISRDTVGLLAPKGREDDPGYTVINPDAINLVSVAGELVPHDDIPYDRPLPYDLTFEDWRGAQDTPWRRGIPLPAIKATVTLTQSGEASLKNRVIVQLPDEYEADPDRQGTTGLSRAGKLLFTGKLRGPQADLDALANELNGWAWGIEIIDPAELPDGTMNNGQSEWKKVRARFFWYPTDAKRFADHGIRFIPEPEQEDFDLKVRWNPR